MSSTTERLLDSFVPENYELYLHPDKEQQIFVGRVTIKGRQVEPSMMIKLHAKGLRIESSKFSIGGGEHRFRSHKYGEHDTLYLTLPSKVSGNIAITLEFRGEITEPMVGLYPCKFTHDGKEKQLLATQFESHHAREVFPCIDEPSAKATFDLTLKTLADEVVLANTEQVSQKRYGDWVETTFATTPKMPTYLLAFVAGELVSSEFKHKSGVVSRVWTTPLYKEHAAFALDVATRTLDFYNEYFDVEYPLNKCDHVALPDFAAGAMENWGLITYRESMFIVDEANTSLENKQSVALVVAHELAHQWFGNLVTMEWWTDLWLNEGFASWIEYLAIDHLFPDWRVWDQFVSDEYLSGMALDSLSSSHPIEIPIDDPDDIRSIFDAISYNKGASVIRMLHAFMGADNFRNGLRQYLVKYSYGNARTDDLWQSLEAASGKPVKQFMSAWTSQTGYPVIAATVDVDKERVSLQQERYSLKGSSADNTIWPVPIDAVSESESYLLDQPSADWLVEAAQKLKLNRSQTGWYITRYDEAHAKRLYKMITGHELEPLDRLGPINDAFRLSKAGLQPTTKTFDLIKAYRDEDNVVVWDVLLSQLVSVRSVFDDDRLLEVLRPYTAQLLMKQYHRLGWDERSAENHFDKLLRPLILAQSCASNMQVAVEEALSRFKQATAPQDIPPDIRGLVCATAGRELGEKAHSKLLDWHGQADSPQIKSQLMAGLCSTREPDLIKRSLQLITSDEVKLQEVAQWVSYLFANHKAKHAAWGWFKNHWEWLHTRFGTDIMTMSYFPKIVGNAFSEQEMVGQYESLFSRVNTKGLKQPVAQGLESLEWRTAWKSRDGAELLDYLQAELSAKKSG